DSYLEEAATKEQLGRLLGDEAPDLLIAASHGMAFDLGDPRQREHQGAILCQDWPGSPELVRRPHWFAAEDLLDGARLDGRVVVLFCCHGMGSPAIDELTAVIGQKPPQIADASFVARLPQRLLARGALAVVGHVDRALTIAGTWDGIEAQPQVFLDLGIQLMRGDPVGWATERLGQFFGTHAGHMNEKWQTHALSQEVDPDEFTVQWSATKNARNFALLGDPAVRIRLPGQD
ncbi:MAG TPA: hypothetical protein VN851_27870, partial [Thermoanaerobaculia bacterium]|nr:hypothetical protein [Thermoanaerobaculia bacterium]